MMKHKKLTASEIAWQRHGQLRDNELRRKLSRNERALRSALDAGRLTSEEYRMLIDVIYRQSVPRSWFPAVVFDIETAATNEDYKRLDLWKHKESNTFPAIVAIGAVLLDEQGEIADGLHLSIIPKLSSEKDYARVLRRLGITHEEMEQRGIRTREAMEALQLFAAQAKVVVSHNLETDLRLLMLEASRRGLCLDGYFGNAELYCTMRRGIEIAGTKLAGQRPRFPRLHELYATLYGERPIQNHEADMDAWLCARCYVGLLIREYLDW